MSLVHDLRRVEIAARTSARVSACRLSADVDLHVPPGVNLELHTSGGDILVGQPAGGTASAPPSVRYLKAKAEFNGVSWSGLGDVLVRIVSVCASGTGVATTELQLEAARKIDVHVDNANIRAIAHGGIFSFRTRKRTGRPGSRKLLKVRSRSPGLFLKGIIRFRHVTVHKYCYRLMRKLKLDGANGGPIGNESPQKRGVRPEQRRRDFDGRSTATRRTLVEIRFEKGSISVGRQR